MPNDDIDVALGVDRIVATLRRWARNANEQGAHQAVLGLLVAANEIERLRQERDEARRDCCRAIGSDWGEDPRDIAEREGWDCFKDVTP
jgi:hypothetical protein